MPTCTKIDPLADVCQLPRPRTTSLFRHLRCGPRLCFSGGAPPCFELYRALLHERPHEPGQFSRHGHRRDLVVLPERQPLEHLVERVLRLPAVSDSVRWLALLASLQHRLSPRRNPVDPRRLHQHMPDPAVARLRDRALVPSPPARVLARHQPDIGHQLARVLEAPEVPDQ